MRPSHRLLLTLIVAFSLVSCGTTPPSKYYLLSPTPTAATQVSDQAENNIRIGLGPIEFPAYLNRNQIIVMTSANTLRTVEYHRWAEPLESNFARVLMQNLSASLPGADVGNYPWFDGKKTDVQVLIEILRFDVDSDNQARLNLRWELVDQQKNMLSPPQRREYIKAAENDKYETLVRAMSECVADFSEDLATSIKQADTTTPVQQ